jgi:hypothetical protein
MNPRCLHSQFIRVRVKRTLGDGRGIEPKPPREYTLPRSRWTPDGRKQVHVG